MKPVIFLDIDGVLNSHRFFLARGKHRPENGEPFWHHDVDPGAVATLNRVVQASGAELVLSSTWRLLWPLTEVSDLLRSRGLSRPLLDKTPEWRTRRGNVVGVYGHRGDEIQAWLNAQPEPPSGIAIVDDDADMAHLLPWLVQTDAVEGLTGAHVDAVLATLGRPLPVAASVPGPGRGGGEES